uniref:Uncharacterized protein n=1 Tax=Grammatophora oceanica TaxID=210454 RepID=A0A7S1Y730_9STRA|mmetsp:Transcript_34895/g.51897  ORF Transcript_34895/g.51897 Transcript_34895/m.51897 type:complete len:134 (+) Transcript_34895:157-558(+)
MLTPEWIDLIRSLRNNGIAITAVAAADRNSTTTTTTTTHVAVHVRRGDISPCKYFRRYYPNSFYLDLIDAAILANDPNATITIYTEDEAYESVQDFLDRGYRVVCGGNVHQVWAEMDTQYDVLITSASTFSCL